MDRRFQAIDVHPLLIEVKLLPAQVDKFADQKGMQVGNEDQNAVSLSLATNGRQFAFVTERLSSPMPSLYLLSF